MRSPETPHWREYPVGLGGELARMSVRTLLPFGVSLLLTFALILAIGIMNEEGLGHDATRALGIEQDGRDAIVAGVEYLLRTSVVLLVVVGYLTGLGAVIALCARDVTASAALVSAAEADAPRTGVPHPNQVESVVKHQFLPLRMLLIISAGSAAFFAAILGIFPRSGGHGPAPRVGLHHPPVCDQEPPARRRPPRDICGAGGDRADHWLLGDGGNHRPLCGARAGRARARGAGQRAEREQLRTVLADPGSSRPRPVILQDHGQRRAVRLAQALAMLAGIGIIVGPATLLLSTFRSEDFPGGVELFTSFRTASVVTIVAAAVLCVAACLWNAVANVRDTDLRNALMRRWPTAPADATDSDGKEIPARIGPALSRGIEPSGRPPLR